MSPEAIVGLFILILTAQGVGAGAIWHKVGKLESAADGYKMCPFYRGTSNPHTKKKVKV